MNNILTLVCILAQQDEEGSRGNELMFILYSIVANQDDDGVMILIVHGICHPSNSGLQFTSYLTLTVLTRRTNENCSPTRYWTAIE